MHSKNLFYTLQRSTLENVNIDILDQHYSVTGETIVDSGIAGFRIFIFKHYIRVIMNDLVVLPKEYLIFFIIYLQKTH